MSSYDDLGRWINTATGKREYIDPWYKIIKFLEEHYPEDWIDPADADPIVPDDPTSLPYLLRDEIAWGIDDQNVEAGEAMAAVSISHNNSPQIQRWIGGGRRTMKQFIFVKLTYRHTTGDPYNTYANPPWAFMGTKKILEGILSANSRALLDQGITFIQSPSIIQDGKNFGNFGLVNNFQTPMNLYQDNYIYKYFLLFLVEIDETRYKPPT